MDRITRLSAEEKVEALRERSQHLIALRESPSYPVLREIIDGKVRREVDRFIETPVVSQQELDYGRGFLNGIRLCLMVIEKGEQEFEKAVQQARVLEARKGAT